MEMTIVMALIALLAGVSFPAITAGLDTIRLNAAVGSIASFFNGALNRADRRQQPIEIVILPEKGRIELYSNEPGYVRELVIPEGVAIEAILPKIADEPDHAPRRLVVMPGGTPPAIGLQLASRKGVRKIVRLDPMTGVPHVENAPRP
jgi:hypothetical protein